MTIEQMVAQEIAKNRRFIRQAQAYAFAIGHKQFSVFTQEETK